MQYRKSGKLDFKVSALGFGCMRLPIIGKDSSKIKEKEAIRMIRYAIDNGVNYIDTAYGYHEGKSEVLVGKALKNGYREKIKLADKLPVYLIDSKTSPDKILNQQLKRLNLDYIDFYLLHGINKDTWDKSKQIDIISWLEKKQKDGKIKHIAFSFHDDFDVFKEIVDAYGKWAFAQIQYNYLDINFQAGIKGLKYAASKGLGIVIMEPLKGGKLASDLPKQIKSKFQSYDKKRNPADFALQWLWNQKEISTVLSGMSTIKQVKENIKSADKSEINSLSKKELNLIEKVRKEFEKLYPIPCTKCNYCMPCPNGVNIPYNFDLYNDFKAFKNLGSVKWRYLGLPDQKKAKSCIKCGRCEKLCPQKIEIMKWLKEVEKELGK